MPDHPPPSAAPSGPPPRTARDRPAMAPEPSRDSVTTIRDDGSRRFIFPTDVRGRFATARKYSALVLIVVYLSLPWIEIGGYPAVFLDVATRRFHLFGITLAAQDLWLLFFIITGLGFSLFFVTALLGRVWCGWACPHTVFLDHVYRRIERWIDGDAVRRRALATASWSIGKGLRRFVKHVLYVLVSAVIAHLFLSYFVSVPEVWSMIRAAPLDHWSAFAFMAVATGLLYFNFAWFREQMCIVICPYGRIQSALIDDESLVIGYDANRGEPRGRPGTAGVGDCVACNRCVQVCPTGIDIRQGLQLECVGCTACIDACDDVMIRLERPTGLIRYDSQNAFAGRPTRWLRTRTVVYGILLSIGAAVAGWALSTVKPASFSVTRIIGTPYIVDAGSVRNQFLVRLVNKRNRPVELSLAIANAPANVRQTGLTAPIALGALGETVEPLILQQPRSVYTGPFVFTVQIRDRNAGFVLERTVEFLGPEARLLHEDDEAEKRSEQLSHARP